MDKNKLKAILSLIVILFMLFNDTTLIALPLNYYQVLNRPNLNNFLLEINKDIKERYGVEDYFDEENVEGVPINKDMYADRGLLIYGSPFGEVKEGRKRFLGYTMEGDYFTNEYFPDDLWKGGNLEDRNWIKEPWKQGLNFRGKQIQQNKIDGNTVLDESIKKGLAYFYEPDGKFSYSKSKLQWSQYVHVLQPPTKWTWGIGVAWHNMDGKTWYKTIPMAPFDMPPPVNLTVQIYDYKNKLKVGSSYIYKAKIENENGSEIKTLVKWTINGQTVKQEDISFAKGEKEKYTNITYTMQESSPSIVKIAVEVNPDKNKPDNETNYDDNKDQIEIEKELLIKPDLALMIDSYTDMLSPGEKFTYRCKITNKNGDALTTNVIWQINGNIVKKEDITFSKGEKIKYSSYTYTMSSSSPKTLTIKATVNPDKNKPSNEETYSNNSDAVTTIKDIPDTSPGGGEESGLIK
ncbi:MAG: Athe_2463 domain-containing protein [Thermovenabulum sp.]|uniref:Athe_2463 domain-containing protein n=1 Tax=Thermovenabulum sp. TaxID=3100335 RepID=UPI003C7D4E0A